jgi:hypothetical protein
MAKSRHVDRGWGRFQYLILIARIPILYARLEDLGPAGIKAWDDFERVETAA